MTTARTSTPCSLAEFGGHFEIHDVAGVVLDDMEHARSAVDGARGGFDLIRSRRSEHLAGTSGVEHAFAHEPHMHGFVAAASTRHDAGLAGNGRVGPHHVNRIQADFQNIRMRQSQPGQELARHILRIVDQFLHASPMAGASEFLPVEHVGKRALVLVGGSSAGCPMESRLINL